MDPITKLLCIGIAFVFGTGLAFWAYRRYTVAVFLIALSPFISALLLPAGSMNDGGGAAGFGSYLRISLLMLVGCVGAMKYWELRVRNKEKLPVQFIFLGLFLLLAVITTIYSIDRFYTFVRAASFIFFFAFLLGLKEWLRDGDHFESVIDALFMMILVCAALNISAMVLLPGQVWSQVEPDRLQGLWGHPNGMGSFCMISYPLMLWKYGRINPKWKWIIVVFAVFIMLLHIQTGSRTTLLASSIGLCVWLFTTGKKLKLVYTSLFVLILGWTVIFFGPASFDREGETLAVTSLTGRTEFWEGTYFLFKERPILGYGFEVEGKIWDDPRFYNPDYDLWRGSSRTSLHNGYLNVLVGTGILGFILWGIALIIPMLKFKLMPTNIYKGFVVTTMVMWFVFNLAESAVNPSSLAAIMFWIAWVLAEKMTGPAGALVESKE